MRLKDKSVFLRQTGTSAVTGGPVSYVSAHRNHLMMFYGDEPESDVADR